MNVIVSNKYQTLLNNLNIDIIKDVNGEFSIDELVSLFSNFYFNKMIIDITAIKNYQDINVIQSLSMNFDMDKIILLLDDSSVVNSPMYISQLVSMGIYNFTRNVNDIKYLINNPNTYKEVARYQNLDGFEKPALNDNSVDVTKGKILRRVIGFKNVTDNAGSTTLVYLLRNHLKNYYRVKAVETDGNDFIYFDDKNLDSINGSELSAYLQNNKDAEVILVDLNGNYDNLCSEVIYLIEPGLVKLNKLIKKDPEIFNRLQGKKIVLNRSVVSNNDINDFEHESGSKIFYNIPNVDDKLDEQETINKFLMALGFSRIENDKGGGIYNIFK